MTEQRIVGPSNVVSHHCHSQLSTVCMLYCPTDSKITHIPYKYLNRPDSRGNMLLPAVQILIARLHRPDHVL